MKRGWSVRDWVFVGLFGALWGAAEMTMGSVLHLVFPPLADTFLAGLIMACIGRLVALCEQLLVATRPRFWLFALAALFIGGALFGPRELRLAFLSVSSQGLRIGLWMSVRAVCPLLIIQLALGGLSVTRLIGLCHSRGLKGLGFALGVAYNMLATLSEISRVVLSTLRLRGAIRRHPLLSLRLSVVSVVSAALRQGENIVPAAATRGFDAR